LFAFLIFIPSRFPPTSKEAGLLLSLAQQPWRLSERGPYPDFRL